MLLYDYNQILFRHKHCSNLIYDMQNKNVVVHIFEDMVPIVIQNIADIFQKYISSEKTCERKFVENTNFGRNSM